MNKKGIRALASAIVIGIVLTTVPPANVKAAPGDVNKVPGKDRYETAANVATANWKEGAENVIIASGEGYADSLSASLLAQKLNAPIILTKAAELHTSAREALKTLKVKNIYVIGGYSSVSQSIRDGLKKDGYELTELGGKDRFETNIAIANDLVEKHGVKADEILVVNGKDGFSDALSAASVAAAKGQILLIVGKEPSTADLATKFIEKHNSKVTVIGTEGVVSKGVYDKLGAKERVKGGANRFETNLNIMKYFKLNTDKLYVANATGEGYADALVASALAGRTGSQLILTDTKDSEGTKNAIAHIQSIKNHRTEVSLVGGNSVIPEDVVDQIKEVVKQENIKKPEKPSKPSKSSNSNGSKKPVEKDKFEIIWSFADVDEDLDVNTKNGKDDEKHDYVYIKFNKPVSITGDAKNALKISNYKLNKMPLPTGTEIKPNIKGLDDRDKVTDSITIVLPNEYLNGKNEPHLITISSYLESTTAGNVLANGGDKTLTWLANEKSIFNASFAAEKQVYLAEVAAKKDLALKDNLINAEKAVETAKASVKSLQVKTLGRAVLEVRVNDVEKTVKDARTKFHKKIDFEFSKGKITKYIGTETDIVIPDTIKGEKVTIIGNGAFENKKLTSVKIPNAVTTIGKEAFRHNCLTSIDIPNSVTTIEMSAFNGNKLQSLVIPDSVTKLERGAFTLNEISDLKLSKNLKTISTAFGYNKLTTVTIPEGVTRIDDMTFSDNQLVEVKLPSTLKYLSGFNNNNFTSITIPKNVEELGKKAFARNNIASVTIPGNVKVVGVSAFQNTWHDTFLTSLNIEEGVEKIEEYAFSLNHLKDVKLPNSVKKIGPNAFHKNLGYDGVAHLFTPDYKNPNKLEESKYQVINPAKLTIKYVFGDKTLKEEEIWKNKTTGEYLHMGDKVVEITPKYEDNEYELENTDAVKVDLNNKDNKLIIKCKKKQVSEKLTIKSIGKVAPVVVDFGTSKNEVIDKLLERTFVVDSNDKKHEVHLSWTLTEYNGNKSGQYNAVGTFKLPEGIVQSKPELKLEVIGNIIVKENFKNEDSKWSVKDFTFEGTTITGFSEEGKGKVQTNKDLILPKVNDKGENITCIANYAFNKNGLTTLVIPEGLNGLRIGTNAFEENKLSKVYVPEGVKEIDAYGFSKNNLKYVDFPGTLKKIGNNAFANNQLVSAVFAKDINKIAIDRFSFCNNQLTSITILNDVKKVNGEAFKDNKGYNSDGKVHIYTLNLDPENCNQWFPNSQYHKVFVLAVESVKEVQPIEVNLGTEKNNIKLPEKITLILNNRSKKEVNVKWSNEKYDANKVGEYTFKAIYDLPEGMTSEKPDVNVKVNVNNTDNEEDDKVINIPDPKLRQVINYTLGKDRKPDAKITKSEMESIKEINGDKVIKYLPMDQWLDSGTLSRGLKSIEGLQYAVNLERLDLSENEIKNLKPLQNLKKLNYIELDRNMLGDITPLSNLTNLTHLNIYNNNAIVDMTPISNLSKLEWLDLHFCNRGKQKVNVEPLGNITTLKMVNLESDLVEDISFAKKLTNVQVIGVGANHITDMTPLSDTINRIYGKGGYIDEEKTYVGMLLQNLKDPIDIKLGYKTSIYEIPNPVKGIEAYMKAYNINPIVRFLGGQENENISLNYNNTTKKIEVIVKGNLGKDVRNIKTGILLDCGKYTLGMQLNIDQEAAKNKEDINKEAVKQAKEDINKVGAFKDVNEENLEDAKYILKSATDAIKVAKKLDVTFDKDCIESNKLIELDNAIKAIQKKQAKAKIPETIKAVEEAFALKDTLNKDNLQKAKGMLSYSEYKLRVVKQLDSEFDKDSKLANKLIQLNNAIKKIESNK